MINFRGKWTLIIVLLFSMWSLISCGATELEERCFPMMVGIAYQSENREVTFVAGFPRVGSSGESEPLINEIQVAQVTTSSFTESKTKYENHINKDADYNHLKVLVLEEKLLEEKDVYVEILNVLAETEEFPRNTYVCIVEDLEKLMEIEKELPQDLGTYLEEYLNNHEVKKKELPTLGDLIDEEENKDLSLDIPVLKVRENYVEWERNFIINE